MGRRAFLAETGIRESDWIGRYWVKWSDAVQEAGYEPNVKQEALDDEYILEHLASLVRDLGHYPTSAELRMRARENPGFGRRAYELAIQLPEPVSTVHTIRTDDPAGIEQYWHERFARCRKNGEWFELTREDVTAFRRRKFM